VLLVQQRAGVSLSHTAGADYDEIDFGSLPKSQPSRYKRDAATALVRPRYYYY